MCPAGFQHFKLFSFTKCQTARQRRMSRFLRFNQKPTGGCCGGGARGCGPGGAGRERTCAGDCGVRGRDAGKEGGPGHVCLSFRPSLPASLAFSKIK